MPATYEPIQTTTLGSAAASYTFSSIPSTYTDLKLVITGTSVGAYADIDLRFNSDTATNYSWTALAGNGTAASSYRASTQTATRMTNQGYMTSSQAVLIADIMNYSNATTYKTVLSRSNNAVTGTDAVVGLWRSTAAITSVTVIGNGSNLATGVSLTLYGIKAA